MRDLIKKITVAGLICLGGLLTAHAAPLATNAPVAADPPANVEYRLHPDDLIEVHIYGEDELTSKTRVNENGCVTLPLLDALKIGGLTVAEANARIRDAYQKDYLVNPVVTVFISEYGNSKVSVLGQVRTPGVYQFPANERLNLLQAIALAGGYTRIGEPSRITIKRTGTDGQSTIIRLDAEAMAKKENTAIFEVKPNDVINVGETIF
jgi:protein involved in polysaccharide export with SLBB domain